MAVKNNKFKDNLVVKDGLEEELNVVKEEKESIATKILNVLLWIIIFLWIAICLIDFYKTRKREEPLFTFKHSVTKYDDGQVDSYLGLGYRIYNYKRKCFDGIEFGPFWTKDGSIESEKCNK